MKAFARLLLDRTFLRLFLAVVVIMCLLLTFREAQTFLACWKCIFAHGHNEKAELREEDVAVILVAAGVFLESLEILARKASRGRGEAERLDLHGAADACATYGAFVVVFGLFIEMVNQVARNLPGRHAVIHLSQAALNIAFTSAGIFLLVMIIARLSRPAPEGLSAQRLAEFADATGSKH